jgi:hypothetical protein
MSIIAPQHKYLVLNTIQYRFAQYKIKEPIKMQIIKNFFMRAWDIIESVQTARAAEHLARCGRYQEVRELMLGKSCSK